MRSLFAPLLSLAFVLLLPVAASQAQDLTGRYLVEGSNPNGQGAYQGEAQVMRAGDVFQVVWSFAGQQHTGTGILHKGIFAVVYQPKGEAPGVALYTLNANGSLSGTWTAHGETAVGVENWRRRK